MTEMISSAPVLKPTDETAPPTSESGATPTKSTAFLPRLVWFTALPILGIAIAGMPYYLLPDSERPFSQFHDWFRPAGYIGQTMGLLSFVLFLFLWMYPIRKRFPFLAFTGPVPRWLNAHIVAGVLVPLLGAIHSSGKFTGIIGLGFGAMIVVALSGVVGRYLYLRIPRRRDGVELGRDACAAERRHLIGQLVESTGFPAERVLELLRPVAFPARSGLLATLRTLLADDFTRRRAVRKLLREWRARLPAGTEPDRKTTRHLLRLARREMALSQQVRLLDATHRIFRLWHLAHLPFAVTAFVAVTIHVAIAVAFGATWFL